MKNSPFGVILLAKIAKEIIKEYSFIQDFYILPPNVKNVIPQMVKFLQGLGYNPIGIGCGLDRLKDYQRQVNYLTSEKSDVKVDVFEIAMVDERTDNKYSGTKVREALKNDHFDEFKSMTPKSIHKFYDELKLKNLKI